MNHAHVIGRKDGETPCVRGIGELVQVGALLSQLAFDAQEIMALAAIKLDLTEDESSMIITVVRKPGPACPRDEPVQLFIVHPLLKEVVPSPAV